MPASRGEVTHGDVIQHRVLDAPGTGGAAARSRPTCVIHCSVHPPVILVTDSCAVWIPLWITVARPMFFAKQPCRHRPQLSHRSLASHKCVESCGYVFVAPALPTTATPCLRLADCNA